MKGPASVFKSTPDLLTGNELLRIFKKYSCKLP